MPRFMAFPRGVLLPVLGLGLALPIPAMAGGLPQPGLQLISEASHGKAISFQKAEAPVSGSFHIMKRDGKTFLVLSQDFSTNDKAPDLHLVVSPSSDPLKGSKAPFALMAGSYTILAPLKSFKGSQTYEIPASIDLAANGSVLVWCRKFNATMAWAPLK